MAWPGFAVSVTKNPVLTNPYKNVLLDLCHSANRPPFQGPSLRNSCRSEQVSPELDTVFSREAEGDDITARHVIDQVVEERFRDVVGVKNFRHLRTIRAIIFLLLLLIDCFMELVR